LLKRHSFFHLQSSIQSLTSTCICASNEALSLEQSPTYLTDVAEIGEHTEFDPQLPKLAAADKQRLVTQLRPLFVREKKPVLQEQLSYMSK
jgi:hypothetical protein